MWHSLRINLIIPNLIFSGRTIYKNISFGKLITVLVYICCLVLPLKLLNPMSLFVLLLLSLHISPIYSVFLPQIIEPYISPNPSTSIPQIVGPVNNLFGSPKTPHHLIITQLAQNNEFIVYSRKNAKTHWAQLK